MAMRKTRKGVTKAAVSESASESVEEAAKGATARADPALPFDPSARADVCLILEGTWPYVRGGVSSWIATLLESMPERRFSVIFLGALEGEHAAPAYPVPPNVVHVERHFLLGGAPPSTSAVSAGPLARLRALPDVLRHGGERRRAEETLFARNAALHERLRAADGPIATEAGKGFAALCLDDPAMSAEALARHPLSWETIRAGYAEAPPGLDFNHYFWTVRGMHLPLFALADIAAEAPPARLYHAVSTGYAGWLGAMLQSRTERPYLISEHGIYTKERELDLAQVDWIPEGEDPFGVGLDDGMNYLRALWIRFFRSLGRMSYASADQVFSLYEGNRRRQIADGAPAEKLRTIPNGIDVARFAAARREAGTPVPPVLALIGRVVPIKDIKTFVRAMRVVRARLPGAEGWLIGPEDEDPAYTAECRRLVASLGLEEVVRFHGFARPETLFPRIGLNVLTSVSEGQPLTVLEGFAAGVPALTTDVGSCRELIEGAGEEDRALGAAGAVVPIASPGPFAEAALRLLGDPDAWSRASAAAVARASRAATTRATWCAATTRSTKGRSPRRTSPDDEHPEPWRASASSFASTSTRTPSAAR